MVAESWFRSLWKTPRKHEGGHDLLVGVLAFEVASLMAKLVHLWKSLSDKQVVKLREEIANSVGIKKLVSDDDDYVVNLICAEMLENLGHVARAVARLAKKCNDPCLKNFQHVFNDLIKIGADPYGWHFTWRKMDRKAKKMERFISMNANLYQDMESLSDLQHTLRRMKNNDDSDSITLAEYAKKVAWKQQEVKHLKDMSLWNRTYDYIVRLLAKSLFTIYSRIGHVFGISHMVDVEIKDSRVLDSDFIHRSHSVSALIQSSVHPSENSILRFSSGPLGDLTTKSGPITITNRTNNFYSGPLGNSTTTVSSNSRNNKATNFYSGPLGMSTTKSGPLARTKKTALRLWQIRDFSSTLQGKNQHPKVNRLTPSGPFKGCMMGRNSSPVQNSNLVASGVHDNPSVIDSKPRLLNAPPETLGAAALALHYANVIIVIEKLVASPHLIGHDARDDLYNMLPANVRMALRERLQPYTKSLTSSVCDTVLAREWSEAMSGILEWLAPLAHNMIRWQSERSFEHQNLVSRTNVLLVQTLYFANQEKAEALITELLVGLNYVWRFGREVNAKALLECASGRTFDNSLDLDGY
ncbi:uncharacterized protein LOC114294141 [Camellia sinensis]|uniref:DUF668 domain-containing protein n=1 Tax=Camellia sinensis var. sinensis TaxID=542762 RepID=A0A4S4DJ14_CAMSN|nr:uncharacterized protein LOC114294141 [Camellia sinensis]XP_028094062.1 uncharacterized protein LOC114294141 [Camellia sinensis]THG02434.1 hypothetical protein TEA_015148 [Camellia sinensis var. sinensis]